MYHLRLKKSANLSAKQYKNMFLCLYHLQHELTYVLTGQTVKGKIFS